MVIAGVWLGSLPLGGSWLSHRRGTGLGVQFWVGNGVVHLHMEPLPQPKCWFHAGSKSESRRPLILPKALWSHLGEGRSSRPGDTVASGVSRLCKGPSEQVPGTIIYRHF